MTNVERVYNELLISKSKQRQIENLLQEVRAALQNGEDYHHVSVKPKRVVLSQFEYSTPRLRGIEPLALPPGKYLRQAQTMSLPFCYSSYFVKSIHSPSGRLLSP